MLDIHNDHTHDLGLLQGKEYNYLDKQIIEKQTVHATRFTRRHRVM